MVRHSRPVWIDRLIGAGNRDSPPALGYGAAVVAVVVAVLLRWLLNPLLDHRLPFLTFFGAVAVAVWFGGWKPGLLAAALGFVAADLLLIETEPGAPLSLAGVGGLAGMVAYLVSCLMIIGFASGMRSAQRRAEASAQEALAQKANLQCEVAQREQAERALHEARQR